MTTATRGAVPTSSEDRTSGSTPASPSTSESATHSADTSTTPSLTPSTTESTTPSSASTAPAGSADSTARSAAAEPRGELTEETTDASGALLVAALRLLPVASLREAVAGACPWFACLPPAAARQCVAHVDSARRDSPAALADALAGWQQRARAFG